MPGAMANGIAAMPQVSKWLIADSGNVGFIWSGQHRA
jgi:hypothetical protein